MSNATQTLINQYINELKKIFSTHLKQIILYGSYARGDYNSNSDIDIMLLVDLTEEQIDDYSDDLSELGFEYNVEHSVWIMPQVKNIEHFNYWKDAYMFYKNVATEGVILYEAA